MSKHSLYIYLFLISYNFVFSQNSGNNKTISPQFEFKQIDSLINDQILKIKMTDSQAVIVSSVRWQVGSFTQNKKKFAAHKNHFNIYILYYSTEMYYIKKIDNFGYYKTLKIDASRIRQFLNSNLKDLKNEKLTPKVDTVINSNNSVTLIQKEKDHQLFEKIKIIMGLDIIEYEFPDEYLENKNNFSTNRYKFLQLVNQVQNQYDKKKPKREKAYSAP